MSYEANTPFSLNTLFLNSKKATSKNPYRFNLTNKLLCPYNTNYLISVQDLEIPNVLNNVKETNNQIAFETQPNQTITFIDFSGVAVSGNLTDFTTFLTNNGFTHNINTLWNTQTYNGLQYKPFYRNGTSSGYIQKVLPNFHGKVVIIYGNPYPAQTVQLLLDGVVEQTLVAGQSPITTQLNFFPNQVLKIQETNAGVAVVLSITITENVPSVKSSTLTFPPDYYTARTFRDYFNTQYPIQFPNHPLITCTLNNLKYNFVSNSNITLVDKPKQITFINFLLCATNILQYNDFLVTNGFETANYPQFPTVFVGNRSGYPIVGDLVLIRYPLVGTGTLKIRYGRDPQSLTGSMVVQVGSNVVQKLGAIDEIQSFSFTDGDRLTIIQSGSGLILYSLEIIYDTTTSINSCSNLIGVSKNSNNQYIYPIVSGNPLYTIKLPHLINFTVSPFMFLRIENITLSNLNSGGIEDNTLVRIPVNCKRGEVIFYRPTELVRFLITRKHFDYISIELLDEDENILDLGNHEFQINLRLENYYKPDMRQLAEGTINHTIKSQKEEPTKD